MKTKLRMLLRSVVLAAALLVSLQASAQRIQFGQSFDKTGTLLSPGDEFAIEGAQRYIAVKMVARGPLPVDTLFLIVKDINGVVGRYYMKRSKSKMDANALIRVKADGIYRIYIYNPMKRIRPVGFATFFVTSSYAPTRAALIERQRLILVERGVIRDKNKTGTTTGIASASGPSASEATGEVEEPLDSEDDLASLDALEDEELTDDLATADGDEAEELDDLTAETDLLGDASESADEDLDGEFESFDDLEEDFDFDLDDF